MTHPFVFKMHQSSCAANSFRAESSPARTTVHACHGLLSVPSDPLLATVRDRRLGLDQPFLWLSKPAINVVIIHLKLHLPSLIFPIYKSECSSQGCGVLPQSTALTHLAKKNTDTFFLLLSPRTTWDEVSLWLSEIIQVSSKYGSH